MYTKLRYIAILIFLMLPTMTYAEKYVCVQPDNMQKIAAGCIRYSALNSWFRRTSFHDSSGNLIDDLRVEFKPGIYSLSRPLEIDRGITGAGKKSITIYAEKPNSVVLSGAKSLAITPAPASFISANQLPTTTLMADLSGAGIQLETLMPEYSFGDQFPPLAELFENGTPMSIASVPESGYLKTEKVGNFGGVTTFAITNVNAAKYLNDSNMLAAGYPMHDWADEQLRVKYSQPAERLYFIDAAPKYGIANSKRIKLMNVLAELKKPGQWYLDAKNKKAYLILSDIDNYDKVSISNMEMAVKLVYAANVIINNINVTAARSRGIYMENVSNIKVNGLVVDNIGGTAISANGKNITFDNVHVKNTGSSGISLSGGDRKSLTPGNITLSNCQIENIGLNKRTYAPAVAIAGVGNKVETCNMFNGPHAAIVFHGNDHIIRNNTITKFVTDSDDAGAIYTGRDWTARGTLIEGNRISNIGQESAHYGANAIYLDDQASGIVISHNVVTDAGRGVMIGGGRDNIITDNLFQACRREGIYIDARGVPLLGESNVVKNAALISALKSYDVTRPPYSKKYPGLAKLTVAELGYPGGNKILNNIFSACESVRVRRPADLGVQVQGSLVTTSRVSDDLLSSGTAADVISQAMVSLQSHGLSVQAFVYE